MNGHRKSSNPARKSSKPIERKSAKIPKKLERVLEYSQEFDRLVRNELDKVWEGTHKKYVMLRPWSEGHPHLDSLCQFFFNLRHGIK